MVVGTVPSSATAEKFGAIKTVDPDYFLGGFYLDTNGGTQTLSNYYEELTAASTISGAVAVTGNLKFVRRDNIVTVGLFDTGALQAFSAAIATYTSTNVPARMCCTTGPVGASIRVTNNAAAAAGFVNMTAGGVITIGVAGGTGDVPGVFTAANGRIYAQNFSFNRTQ
jgi:hypothetical protein